MSALFRVPILACLVAGLALAASGARSIELERNATGKWSDPLMWYVLGTSEHTVPQSGDSIFTYGRNTTLTMDSDISMPFTMLIVGVTDNQLRFHGDGRVLECKGSSIAKIPFYLYTPANWCWQFYRAAGDGTAYRFENPEFVVSNVSGTTYFDFLKGSYNFYDPDGTAHDVTNWLFDASNEAAEFIFRKDATLRLGTAYLRQHSSSSAGDVALRFEGGEQYVKALIWNPTYAPPHEMLVSLKGGTHLTTDKINMSYDNVSDIGAVAGKPIRAVLDLSEGSRLDVADGFSAYGRDKDLDPEVHLDHATLASDGTGALNFGLAYANETNYLTAVDSTIAWTNGAFTCGQFASLVQSASFGALTNVDIAAKTFCFYTGADYRFKDCRIYTTTHNNSNFGGRNKYSPNAQVVFDHCTITNLNVVSYNGSTLNFTNVIHFTGGTQADLWDLYASSLPLYCRIDGGSRVNCMVNSGNRYLSTGWPSELTVSNATYTAAKAHYYLGMNKLTSGDYAGTLRVQDGAYVYFGGQKIDGSTGVGLGIGYAGRGRLEVSGGVLWANTITVGAQPCGAAQVEPSALIITGGEVHVRDTDYWAGISFGCAGGHPAACILDGGALYAPQLAGNSGSVTSFSADGGTLVIVGPDATQSDYDLCLIKGFTTAEIGAKGLTVELTSAPTKIKQSIANKAGEAGVFHKIGAKALSLGVDSWTVSETRIEEGKLHILNATQALNTKLVMEEGTTLSLTEWTKVGDCESLTLDALTALDLTIEFDPGDVIYVPADKLKLSKLCLRLASDPTEASTNALFVTTGGALDADVAWAIRRARVENILPTGYHSEILTDYNSGTGITTFRFAVSRDREPLADETVWQSGSSDGWASSSSWTAGVPTATKVASFSRASGVTKTVTVPASAVAGALTFGAQPYTLSGTKPLSIPSSPGAARLTTEVGTNSIAAPLSFDSVAIVTNVSGSKLSVGGNIASFGLEKVGKGELSLLGSNAFYRPVVQREGRLTVRNSHALGADQLEDRIRLTADTITFDDPNGAEMRIDRAITVAAPTKRSSAIIECRTPVTITNWQTTTQGALIKRGVAPLTIEFGGDAKLNAQCAMTGPSHYPSSQCSFPADGTSPDGESLSSSQHYYTGFSIAEGEVVFKAIAGLAERPKLTSSCQVMNCIMTKDGTATPILTVDGVDLNLTGVFHFLNGTSLSPNTHFCRTPVIRILNGARIYGYELSCKRYGWTNGCQPVWALTNGTLQAKAAFLLDWMNEVDGSIHLQEGAYVVYRAKDSELLTDTDVFKLHGAVRGDFVNTYFGPTDKTKCATILARSATPASATTSSCGEMAFRSNSVFNVSTLSFLTADWQPKKSWAVFKLIFDGSEWRFGDDDWTLKKDWFNPTYRDDHFKVESQGDGIILSPAEGKTWRTEFPISGDGGVTVNGPGTVKFDEGMYQMTGPICALQGVLDLTSVGTLTDTVIRPGDGTIKGGKFYNATIELAEQGGAVPNFENCTFTGTTTVTIAGELTRGDNVLVGTYTGTVTGVDTFVFHQRDRFRGENFRAEDGKITFRLAARLGLMVIIHH